jgi:hypothetical protein
MQQKTMALLVIALLMSAAFLIGSFFSMFISQSQLTVPASHKTIVDSMTVTDTWAYAQLTPKLVESNNVEYAKGLSVVFIKGKVYPQTLWVWQRYGDTELVMNIWGPDESGKTYGIEISRLAWDPFVVKINGVTKLTIDPVTSTAPAIGYYELEVTCASN